MYGPPSTSYGGRGGRDDGGGSRGGGGGRDGGFPRGGGGGGRRSPSPESRGYRGGRPPIDEGWSRAAPAPASHSFERDAYGGSDSYRGRPSRGGGARGGRSDRGFEETSFRESRDFGRHDHRTQPSSDYYGGSDAKMMDRGYDRDRFEGGYSRFSDRGSSRGGGTRGGRRREDERMVRHKSTREEDESEGRYIADRINKERPCRTLFVRNLKFETPSDEVRGRFDMMGEVKSFFDLIPNRGMVFVTYYDIRAAIMAKEKLQGSDFLGRPMDVHYSLPRDEDREKRCDREKNQGSLTLSVQHATTSIDEGELAAKFAVFGDVKAIFPSKTRPSERYIEYYDCRGCERAFDQLNGSSIAGGTMDLHFAWDVLAPPPPRPVAPDYSPTRATTSANYGRPLQAAPAPLPSLNERLEQAQKVQQMLASLAAPAHVPAPPARPLPVGHQPPYSVQSQYASASYLPPPPPPPTSAPPSTSSAVPPAILALLAAQSAAPAAPPPPAPLAPLTASLYHPAPSSGAADAQSGANQVQALLALLAQQQQRQ